MPDIFISGEKTKTQSESRVPPNVPCDRDSPHQVYYNYHGPDSVSPVHKQISLGRGNTHRARLKWLNSPVIGTQYIKEERQTHETTAKIPEEKELNGDKQDDSHAAIVENGVDHNPLVNGDASAYEDAPVGDAHTKSATDEDLAAEVSRAAITVESKVTTTTITVTETELVPNGGEAVPESQEEIPDSADVESPVVSPTKSAHSSDGLNVLSDDGTPESTNADGSKPQKVKKQKSFKKALM